METIRMFAAPHKALRKTMAAFVVQAGQTNFGNPKAVEKLKQAGEELFLLLSSHAHTEDTIVLSTLDKKLPGASEHDKLDHLKIEELQYRLELDLERLSVRTTADEAHAFYLKFADFHSMYLEHMHEEETITQELIWDYLTPEEQFNVRVQIIDKMDPDVYAIWLKHMIPAQNETENLAMLAAVRQNMPVEKFSVLMKNMESQMGGDDFESLTSKLSLNAQSV